MTNLNNVALLNSEYENKSDQTGFAESTTAPPNESTVGGDLNGIEENRYASFERVFAAASDSAITSAIYAFQRQMVKSAKAILDSEHSDMNESERDLLMQQIDYAAYELAQDNLAWEIGDTLHEVIEHGPASWFAIWDFSHISPDERATLEKVYNVNFRLCG